MSPSWFCNKCGRVGVAKSRENANEQHRERSPECNYFPSWNWTPSPEIAEQSRRMVEEMLGTPSPAPVPEGMTTPQRRIMKTDEFAPHWSAILQKDGTLAVTIDIETTLTDLPDLPLIELLRTAIVTQRGETVALRLIVSGQEHRAEFSTAATIRSVIAKTIDATHNVGRKADEWELRDANGHHIDHDLTLGAALANFPNSDPLWLSPRAGWAA